MGCGRQRSGRIDRGESLIEALVTISILGIAVVALLGAVLIGVKTSVLHRKHAQAQAELRSWAERIGTAPGTGAPVYTDCARPANFPALNSPTPGISGSVTSVRYWDGDSSSFRPSCGPDPGLQKVTLRITVAAGIHPGFSQTLDVVVRKSCATTC